MIGLKKPARALKRDKTRNANEPKEQKQVTGKQTKTYGISPDTHRINIQKSRQGKNWRQQAEDHAKFPAPNRFLLCRPCAKQKKQAQDQRENWYIPVNKRSHAS